MIQYRLGEKSSDYSWMAILVISFMKQKMGKSVIAMFKSYKPHVVIMDIRMQNVDGIEAIKKIMKFDPDAKIIVTSTKENKEIIDAAVKSREVKDHIIKPFHLVVVMAISKQLLVNRNYKRSSTSFRQI